MSGEDEFDQASRKAEAARLRFAVALNEAKWRFSPPQLKAEARDKASQMLHLAGEKSRQSVRDHPFVVAGAISALAGWLFRRPLGALSRLLYVKVRDASRTCGDTEDEQ